MNSSTYTPAAGLAPANQALTPVADADRVFGTANHASLWFSLGVGLLVMQVGAYLMPALGTREALIAIVAGSLLGAFLLGWVAKLGCDSGLASAGLMHATYGSAFAKLPIVLNIVQLLGWGAFELVVMRDATAALAKQATGSEAAWIPLAGTLLWGGIVMLLLTGSMLRVVRQIVSRVALPLVVMSLVWLSWQFLGMAQAKGWDALWSRAGAGGMGVMPALDLVIAMPISWLPLVADYARHGRSGKSALAGTWLGYTLANIWCYAMGVLVVLTLPEGDLVTGLLLAQGGLLALSVILIDEVDNAYGDAYSGAVSSHSLVPSWSIRRWGLVMAAGCTLLALVLPMHSLEPFLLMLSSVFVPLFGTILGRLALGGLQGGTAALMAQAGRLNLLPVLIWLTGVAVYHLCAQLAPALGAAIPSLVLTFVLALATRPRAA